MILTFDQLPAYRGLVSLVDGAFDPLHGGHIAYFHAAAALGHPLLCTVAADGYLQRKHRPLIPDTQRVQIIDALRDITFTHFNERDTADVLETLQPIAYIKGRDWEGRLPIRQVAICQRLDIPIVFLDTVRESSSRLLDKFARTDSHVGIAFGE